MRTPAFAERRTGRAAVASLWRAPETLAEVGVEERLLAGLLCRHLLAMSHATAPELAAALGLIPSVVHELLARLVSSGDVLRTLAPDGSLRFTLSGHGEALAVASLASTSYVGPAPISLPAYRALVMSQRRLAAPLQRSEMQTAFSDAIVDDALLELFGRAVNSPLPILLQGPSGAGKTYLALRLARAIGDSVLIPHAIAIGDAVIPILNGALHQRTGEPVEDGRLVSCHRPAIVVGAELRLSMLGLLYDAHTRTHVAPLQLKANNGSLVIDDLGAQETPVRALLNRWSIPFESGRDWLTLDTGMSFDVPFDVGLVLVGSSGLGALPEDGVMRRIDYRIRLGDLDPARYDAVWERASAELGLRYDPALSQFAVEELHAPAGVPLLAGHPRRLLQLAIDEARYRGEGSGITADMLAAAWKYLLDSDAFTAHP